MASIIPAMLGERGILGIVNIIPPTHRRNDPRTIPSVPRNPDKHFIAAFMSTENTPSEVATTEKTGSNETQLKVSLLESIEGSL